MKNVVYILLLFLGINYCYSQDEGYKPKKPIEISIQELTKRPKKYDGKFITVRGYAKFNKSGSRVFISKSDFEKDTIENSVYFDYFIEMSTYPTVERCEGKYCKLSGIYISRKSLADTKELKLKNGIISEVRAVYLIEEE